jgi:hypothetical protein
MPAQGLDLNGFGGFQQICLHEVVYLSIPSARHTDKADGPRRAMDGMLFARQTQHHEPQNGGDLGLAQPARPTAWKLINASTTRRSTLP